MNSCLRIVLTGGPGGGKTTLMNILRTEDPYSKRWLLVPEVAPLLFQAGLNAREKKFQRAVVRLQIALEDACAEVSTPGQVLVCHRGTLDPLAYWLRAGWLEPDFFTFTKTTYSTHFQRYQGVIHLQTAAIGASAYYRRWPEAHRPETPEAAAETDRLCAWAWRNHPHYALIENIDQDWSAKANAARKVLNDWLT